LPCAASTRPRRPRSPPTPPARKDYGVDPDRRRAEWASRAAEFGLDRKAIRELLAPGREPRLSRYAAVVGALRDLERARSHFDRRDLLCALADRLGEGADLDSLTNAVDRALASELVLPLGRPTDPSQPAYFTTPRLWELERRFVEIARRGLDTGVATRAPQTLAEVLRRHPYLGDDQRQMVRRLVEGGERIVPVAAMPGAGKTTALAAAREAWEAQGHPVIGVATARSASGELRDIGVPSRSTVAFARTPGGDDCRGVHHAKQGLATVRRTDHQPAIGRIDPQLDQDPRLQPIPRNSASIGWAVSACPIGDAQGTAGAAPVAR
jgi:hypothetical protein